MAKYTVMMGCGHEDTVDLIGKGSERERKIKYFESNGLCRECYKKKMDEKRKAEGFIFKAAATGEIDDRDGKMFIEVYFTGDTYPYKDKVKNLGYIWDEVIEEWDGKGFSPQKYWSKYIKLENLDEEIEKAISIGAKNTVSLEEIKRSNYYRFALKDEEKWKEMHNRIDSIEKPRMPDVISGHRWNRKIYGKPGNYSIYLDGEKASITDDQAEEIREYLKHKEEYDKKIEEIKNA